MKSNPGMTRDVTALAGPVAAATFVGGVAAATALSDAPYPRPGASEEQIRQYFADNAGPARISIAGQLISAAALGVFSIAGARLARRAQPNGRALAAGAEIGGALSVATLMASALTSLQLTRHGVAASNRASTLHRRVFVAGGPLHGPAIGLLMGSLGAAGLRMRTVPRWAAIAALATAAAGMLAPLALVKDEAVWLIPASRFPGLLLAATAGVALNRR